MKNIKKVLALVLVAISVFAITVPAMATYSTMYVDGDVGVGYTVRLRSAPNTTTSTVIVNIPYATAVQAEYYNSSWHRVNWGSYSGYMLSEYLSPTDPLNGSGTSTVNVNWVNATSTGPGTLLRIYSTMSPSSSYTVVPDGVTIQLRYATNDVGWVMAKYGTIQGYVMKGTQYDLTTANASTGMFGSNLLRRGCDGQAVRNLQMYLTDYGISTQGIDGDFGPNTESAVKSFQRSHNIAADGVVGDQTKEKLVEAIGY